MKKRHTKALSVMLCILLCLTAVLPGLSAFAANAEIQIYRNGEELTERLSITEYFWEDLTYVTAGDVPEGAWVEWESNLPLLAGVDENGRVHAYDFSKGAVIENWLDNEVAATPVVGSITANAIRKALEPYDLDSTNTDILVLAVRAVAGDALADSFKAILDDMNVKITATLRSADGTALASDTAEVVVTQNIAGNISPTGAHITNKKTVPKTVAVGAQVQLYGAITPIRLKQGTQWNVGKPLAIDTESSKHATVSADGLVTFTSPGKATIRVQPQSTLYGAYFDSVEFMVVDPAELPVTDFTIAGTLEVNEGEKTQLSIADLVPEGAYIGSAVWQSADPTVAVVDQNGLVTGLDAGSGIALSKSTAISVTLDGITKSVTVKVNKVLIGSTISGVRIDGYDAAAIGETTHYGTTVAPDRLNSNKDVLREWGIKHAQTGEILYAAPGAPVDNGFASLDADGNLTPRTAGLIELHARATYNGTVVEAVKTVSAGTPITSFTIGGAGEVREGETIDLSITNINPADYDPNLLDHVIWEIADENIAAINQNGRVIGRDGGGLTIFNTQKVTVTATIGGVKATKEITVRAKTGNNFSDGSIYGNECVVVDFPRQYTAGFYPDRMHSLGGPREFWSMNKPDGSAPWNASNTMGSITAPALTLENDFARMTDGGMVSGKAAGQITLYKYYGWGVTTHLNLTKNVTIVELAPKSIAVVPPVKSDYIEGDTELDLTGLEVKATYDRADLAEYYPDADSYDELALTVPITDYTVGEIDPDIIDREQYILVTVTRAGKSMRSVFPITVHSKQVDTIEITEPPRYAYIEGETAPDLSGMKVVANYLNAPSEEITDYTVDTDAFDPALLHEEQTITVTYTHYGRTAAADFKVMVYGKPVVSFDTGDYKEGWTANDVTFTLSSTHMLDGATYYYSADGGEWTALAGNTLTVATDTDAVYRFKAINSAGIESEPTQGCRVSLDKVVPSFNLIPETEGLTNTSYKVQIAELVTGASGVKRITLNGADITGKDSFMVDANGAYTVAVTSNSGLSSEKTITISNIDKVAPVVTEVKVYHKYSGGFARFLNELTFGLFFNETVEFTVNAADEGVAGIDRIEYRFLDENGNPLGAWALYDSGSRPQQEPDFKGYMEARAFDRAGNESEAVCSDGYVIDGTVPTDVTVSGESGETEYNSGEWAANDVTLTLSSEAFSDIYEYQYRVNGGAWTSLPDNTLTVRTNGEYTYEFKAISNAALESHVTTYIVKIDKVQPVVRVEFEGTFGRWTSDDVTFRLSTENEVLSGVTYYYSDGGAWIPFSGDEIVLHEDTEAVYRFKVINGAGTESTPSDAYIVKIDTVAPSIQLTPTVTGPTDAPYDIAFTTSAGPAGIDKVYVNGEDITGKDKITVSENGNYVFVLMGNNGLNTIAVHTVSNMEEKHTLALQVGVSGALNTWTNKDVVFTLNAKGAVGAAAYYYRTDGGEWTALAGNTLTVNTDTAADYTFKAIDETGAESYESAAYTVLLEKTAPTAPVITATADGAPYVSGTAVTGEIQISIASEAASDIAYCMYRVDGGAWILMDDNTLTVTEYGAHAYDFRVRSNAGNVSNSISVLIDREKANPVFAVNKQEIRITGTGTVADDTFDYRFICTVTPEMWAQYFANTADAGDTDCITEIGFVAKTGVMTEEEARLLLNGWEVEGCAVRTTRNVRVTESGNYEFACYIEGIDKEFALLKQDEISIYAYIRYLDETGTERIAYTDGVTQSRIGAGYEKIAAQLGYTS